MYLCLRGTLKKKKKRPAAIFVPLFYLVIILIYLQVCSLFRAAAEVSAVCFEEIDGTLSSPGRVKQGLIFFHCLRVFHRPEMSAEIQKLNNGMEICLLLPHFLTVLVLLESLCASIAGASPWHSLVYLGSM